MAGIRGFLNQKFRAIKSGTSIHRSGKQGLADRRIKKVLLKEMWFKEKKKDQAIKSVKIKHLNTSLKHQKEDKMHNCVMMVPRMQGAS